MYYISNVYLALNPIKPRVLETHINPGGGAQSAHRVYGQFKGTFNAVRVCFLDSIIRYNSNAQSQAFEVLKKVDHSLRYDCQKIDVLATPGRSRLRTKKLNICSKIFICALILMFDPSKCSSHKTTLILELKQSIIKGKS